MYVCMYVNKNSVLSRFNVQLLTYVIANTIDVSVDNTILSL